MTVHGTSATVPGNSSTGCRVVFSILLSLFLYLFLNCVGLSVHWHRTAVLIQSMVTRVIQYWIIDNGITDMS
jgi:hypothetical protein